MTMPKLNLLVLRARDPARLSSFYAAIGLGFVRHRHGKGAEHYACESGEGVFEIYPASSDSRHTSGLRLGFAVENVQQAVAALLEEGATLHSPPKESPWGLRAVLEDPEGHKLELTGATDR